MPDRLKPMTKVWHDRQRRHRHNSFTGFVRMMQMQCNTMLNANSVTPEARKLIAIIANTASALDIEIRKRID